MELSVCVSYKNISRHVYIIQHEDCGRDSFSGPFLSLRTLNSRWPTKKRIRRIRGGTARLRIILLDLNESGDDCVPSSEILCYAVITVNSLADVSFLNAVPLVFFMPETLWINSLVIHQHSLSLSFSLSSNS